jgi:UPF0755 protein
MTESKYRRRRLIALIALVAIAIGGFVAWQNKGQIRTAFEQLVGNDYQGSGHGEVLVTIAPGDTGEIVALKLEESGVVKSFRTTYKLIIDTNQIFFPGTYRLKYEMSSRSALSALADTSASVVNRVTVKEGMRLSAILKLLSEKTGISRSQLDSAASDLTLWNLPDGAPSLEGYLFPATYAFSPDSTAETVLREMRMRMEQEIEKFQIPKKDVHRVLTLAALIQKEARIEADFYKASRTFLNRLEVGMHLQSDATVSYGVGGSTVSTSAADRANDNPYNTYLHAGLPAGPISAPGSVAIDAALNPADGEWLYFCTINLSTGETVFSNTYSEHQKAVAKWRAWMKENPGYE